MCRTHAGVRGSVAKDRPTRDAHSEPTPRCGIRCCPCFAEPSARSGIPAATGSARGWSGLREGAPFSWRQRYRNQPVLKMGCWVGSPGKQETMGDGLGGYMKTDRFSFALLTTAALPIGDVHGQEFGADERATAFGVRCVCGVPFRRTWCAGGRKGLARPTETKTKTKTWPVLGTRARARTGRLVCWEGGRESIRAQDVGEPFAVGRWAAGVGASGPEDAGEWRQMQILPPG